MNNGVPASDAPTFSDAAGPPAVSEKSAQTEAGTARDPGRARYTELSPLMGEFLGHVAAGTVGFIGLGIPAVLLSLATHYVEIIPNISIYVVYVLTGADYALLGIDASMFTAYMMVTVFVGAKNLLRYVKAV